MYGMSLRLDHYTLKTALCATIGRVCKVRVSCVRVRVHEYSRWLSRDFLPARDRDWPIIRAWLRVLKA